MIHHMPELRARGPEPQGKEVMERYDFFRSFADGARGPLLGYAVRYEKGWRFFVAPPFGGIIRSSRAYHPTMEKCLPRWIGYPDYCESVFNPPDWEIAS